MDDIALLSQQIGELKGAFGSLATTIQQTQTQQREDIGKLYSGLSDVSAEISKLPCGTQIDRLKKVEDWQVKHNGVGNEIKMEGMKSSWSLRNGLILAAATLISSAAGGILVYWFTCGVK
jgi:hypothetical protein